MPVPFDRNTGGQERELDQNYTDFCLGSENTVLASPTGVWLR
jgi:hypothetical protein